MNSKSTKQQSNQGAGTSGTTGTNGTGFNAAQLHALTGGAKVGAHHRVEHPHHKHDPDAKRTGGMNLRTNEYDRALYRHVAGLRGESVQQTIRALLHQAMLAELEGR